MIRTAGEAIDEAARGLARDRKGANAIVGDWLDVAPALVSGWRTRGISRNYAMHFFVELVERRKLTLAPQVFGLDDWSMVIMPDTRGRKLKRVA
jgi:hypothetical protein